MEWFLDDERGAAVLRLPDVPEEELVPEAERDWLSVLIGETMRREKERLRS